MTDKQLDVLINIVAGVESGGQIYGNRRYDAYAAPYKNSQEEHTCTLGYPQFYGHNARKLCQRIFEADKTTFRKNDTAKIENRLTQDWVAIKWNPSVSEKSALLKIISSDVGKKIQDEMFKEDLQVFINDAIAYGISDVGAQIMYCEIRHLGGKSPTERIFKRADKPYTADTIYSSLLLDQKDTSNSNQVGDKKYQSRHQKCVEWVHKYIDNSVNVKNEINEKDVNLKMTVDEYIQKVIDIAKAEIGYLEKKSNKSLDNKTANAGSANYTKYGRDMHNLYPAIMDFPAAWCDAFVDWCFYKAYGVSNSKALLAGNYDDYTIASAQLYKNKGAWYKSNPKVGDQIFFTNASGGICHTGLVVKVTKTQVIAIEGNTSSASGVVANGGCVREKTYPLSYSRIAGYGRPAYEKFCSKGVVNNNTVTTPSTSTSVTKLNETKKWNGIVTADSLNVRTWAGSENPECSFSPLKKNTEVKVCDSIKASDGSTWYYIKYNKKYGFVHSGYIKKKTNSLTLESAKYKDNKVSGLYKTTSNLKMRYIAGKITKKNIITVIPKGDKVQCYGYYNMVGGTKWYLVAYKSYTGYVSSKYLKK